MDATPFISGGLLIGPSGFSWSPDNSVLYVSGRHSGNVLAYDAATGAPLATGHVVASGLGMGSTFGLTVAPNGHVFVATSNVVRRYSPAGTLLATITLASIGLELSPDGTGVLAASGGTIRRINIADNAAGSPQISPAVGGTLNFFYWPPRILEPQGLIVEVAGQRYLAVQFTVSKWSPGASSVQVSDDWQNWQPAVTYSPTGYGVAREGSQTVQHQLIDQGGTVMVIERDNQPAGTFRRRFLRGP